MSRSYSKRLIDLIDVMLPEVSTHLFNPGRSRCQCINSALLAISVGSRPGVVTASRTKPFDTCQTRPYKGLSDSLND